jgi:UDP-N-acetylmuramate--alanine ligase
VVDRHLDLSAARQVHIVGIGGAGMSAIAAVLIAMGHTVTGSDLKSSRAVDRLSALGARIAVGHDEANLGAADLVAVSTAIGAGNPEVLAAAGAGVPVFSRAEILSEITGLKRTLSVAGTHGKTTTASMLAVALTAADLSPSFIIGGDVNEIGSGAVWSDGDWFVVEADESDGTMVELDTQVGLITNIEADHLGHYGSEQALQAGFAAFADGSTETVIGCADDPGARRLARSHGGSTYGHHGDADVRLVDLVTGRAGSAFTVEVAGTRLDVELPMPGAHNALNAVGAVAGAQALGADLDRVAEALGRFGGVARRFELRGECGGVTFVDDYAHLPTEIRAALAAAAAGGWRRIVCVATWDWTPTGR